MQIAPAANRSRPRIGTGFQQEMDIPAIYSDVAVFSEQVLGPEHVQLLVDSACRSALARRGVAHLVCPVDVQDWPAKDGHYSMMNVKGKAHTATSWTPDLVVLRRGMGSLSMEIAAGVRFAISRAIGVRKTFMLG